MVRKDAAMFTVYRNAITQRDNFMEIATCDMLRLVSEAVYAIPPT